VLDTMAGPLSRTFLLALHACMNAQGEVSCAWWAALLPSSGCNCIAVQLI
jgi:hypothetical protein